MTAIGHRCVLSWKVQNYLRMSKPISPEQAERIEDTYPLDGDRYLEGDLLMNPYRWETDIEVVQRTIPDRTQDLPGFRCECAPKPGYSASSDGGDDE